MNKIYPTKTIDFTAINEEETKFLKNLKKIKIKKINCKNQEIVEFNNVKLIRIPESKLEDFSSTDTSLEDVDLSNFISIMPNTKTIKEILATDISTPIAELLNIDVTEHIQNALENFVSMISVNKNS